MKTRRIRSIGAAFFVCLGLSLMWIAASFTASASQNMTPYLSSDIGLVINGSYFTHDGHAYQNYQNAYTKKDLDTQGDSEEIETHFGRNIYLRDGSLEIELIDLTERVTGKGVVYLPGDFQSVYTLPLNEDPDAVRQAFIDKYREVIRSGFSMGTTRSGIYTWQGMLQQEYKYTDSSAVGHGVGAVGYAALVYNPVLKKCFLYKDGFVRHYSSSNGFHSLGAPVGDEFDVTLASDNKEYTIQNFAGGYLKLQPGSTVATKINYYNVTPDGYERRIVDGNLYGNVGTVVAKYNDYSLPDRTAIGNVFLDRYDQEVALGRNPGIPRNFVDEVQGVLMQFYQRESGEFSNALCAYHLKLSAFNQIGYSNIAALVYNPRLGSVYWMTDEILTRYIAEHDYPSDRFSRTISALGAPIGDAFVYGQKRYQNFENGYIAANSLERVPLTGDAVEKRNGVDTKLASEYTTTVMDKNFIDGKEVAVSERNDAFVGHISDSAVVPAGMSRQELSQMFTEKYEELKRSDQTLVAASTVKSVWRNGIRTTLQILRDGDGALSALCFDTANGAIRRLSPKMYEAFLDNIILGHPVGEETVRNGVPAQFFQNGCVELGPDGADVRIGVEYNEITDDYMIIDYGDLVGIIGSVPNKHPVKNASSHYKAEAYEEEHVTAAMKAAYKELIASGYNPGVPSVEGVNWFTTGRYGLVVQNFYGGDGGGEYNGINNMLCFDPTLRKAYLLTGEILTAYCQGLPMIVGRPAENQTTASDGTVAQSFFGPMGDFHFRIEDGKAVYYEGAFYLNEYEETLKADGKDPSSSQEKDRGCGGALSAGRGAAVTAALMAVATGLAALCLRRKAIKRKGE